jgi:RNA polymerase sigma-70 factor (ECF subfamily)
VKVDGRPQLGDARMLAQLRAGDEAAFEALVKRHHGEMLAVARSYVRTRALAEEVVQETWLAVLTAIDRFEARASLKTWIFRILVNTAMTRGSREARTMPFSSLESGDEDGPAVDPERFGPTGEWHAWPPSWTTLPEDGLFGRETIEVVRRAVQELPPRQGRVIALRDIAGFTAEEVATMLDISPGNQRILLHRARSKVRTVLERHLHG